MRVAFSAVPPLAVAALAEEAAAWVGDLSRNAGQVAPHMPVSDQ